VEGKRGGCEIDGVNEKRLKCEGLLRVSLESGYFALGNAYQNLI